MVWNKECDFSKLLGSIESEAVTKRLISRTTVELYDPLGIRSPVIILL